MTQQINELNDLKEGDEVRRANEPNGPTYTVINVPEPNALSGEVEKVSLGAHGAVVDPEQWVLEE